MDKWFGKHTQLSPLRQYNGFSPWPEDVEFIVLFLLNGFIHHRLSLKQTGRHLYGSRHRN